MIRMLLLGYAMGIRSERRLWEEVHLKLAYRRFCRLEVADYIPDHFTSSKNRHGRFRDSNFFRHLFETAFTRCIAQSLVGGEAFGVDAAIVQADAKRLSKVRPRTGRQSGSPARPSSTLKRWTTRPSEMRRRSSRRSCRRLIRRGSLTRRKPTRSLPIQRTTSSSLRTLLSWMSRRPHRSARRKL